MLKVNPSCSTLENTQPCTHTCNHTREQSQTHTPTIAPPNHMAQAVKHQGLTHPTQANKNLTLCSPVVEPVLAGIPHVSG